MPANLDSCVQGRLAAWKKDPSSRPKHKEGQKPKEQAFAICTASLKGAGKLEDNYDIMLEESGNGPTILGAGATNRPIIKGLPPIAIFEEDGEKLLRIPLLLEGKWKSRYGILEFTKKIFGIMVRNHEDNVVGNELSYDNRHKPELGAIAWFKRFAFEQIKRGEKLAWLLFGIAKPTPRGLEEIENKAYKYASIEFSPNFEHPLVAFGEVLTDKDLLVIDIEEVAMPEGQDTKQLEDKILEMEEQLIAAGKLADLVTTQSKQLEVATQQIGALQLESQRYRSDALKARIDQAITAAEGYRDDGKAHSKLFLEFFKNMMLGSDIGEGDGVIKLEDDESNTTAYYRSALVWLSENLPGVVPMNAPQSERDKSRPVTLGDDQDLDQDDVNEIRIMWGGKAKAKED